MPTKRRPKELDVKRVRVTLLERDGVANRSWVIVVRNATGNENAIRRAAEKARDYGDDLGLVGHYVEAELAPVVRRVRKSVPSAAGKRRAKARRPAVKRRNPARRTVGRAALTYDVVSAMSGAEINKRLDALAKESSALVDELIAAGRGSERYSETSRKTDPLSLRYVQNSADASMLRDEITRRYGPGAPSRLPRGFGPIRRLNPAHAPRRNPAEKPRTYAVARAQIINALRADGWDVRENLKVPHATHPSGEFRLWFKTQAIYYTTGDRRRGCGSLSDARSLWIGDIRAMPVAEVLADIERARLMEMRGR